MGLFSRKPAAIATLPVVSSVTRDRLPEVSVDEIVGNYEILGTREGVVLVQPLPHVRQMDEWQPVKRLANSTIANPNGGAVAGAYPDQRIPLDNLLKMASPSINRVEYNMDLRGAVGRKVYDQMRRSDSSVRMSLKILKTPIHAARWFVSPYDEKKRSQTIADFCWWNLQNAMNLTWSQFLQEALLSLDFGFYGFEKVWSINKWGRKQMVTCALEPRHALDVFSSIYNDDGSFAGFEMWGNPWDAELYWLPQEKVVTFTYDGEAGDVEGISVLRSAYKHWYYAENFYKIDGIQKERHGIGIPVIQLPPGFNQKDLSLADEMGRNLRTNERAHVVIPPNWTIMMLKLEGQHVDALASAQHHKHEIAKNVLAPFVDSERGLIDEHTTTFFLKNARYVADLIADQISQRVFRPLVDFNWPGINEYPTMKVRRIGDTADWRAISFAVRNLVGAGIIIPDEGLEEWFRDEMDLSPIELATQRQVATPQAGMGSGGVPAAGPPRQSPAGGMQQQAKGTGKANVGTDGSGTTGTTG